MPKAGQTRPESLLGQVPLPSPSSGHTAVHRGEQRGYSLRRRLTLREAQLLRKLPERDGSLYISRRMVQRYVTSIYEKTGTKSRTGLHQRYTQHMLENR